MTLRDMWSRSSKNAPRATLILAALALHLLLQNEKLCKWRIRIRLTIAFTRFFGRSKGSAASATIIIAAILPRAFAGTAVTLIGTRFFFALVAAWPITLTLVLSLFVMWLLLFLLRRTSFSRNGRAICLRGNSGRPAPVIALLRWRTGA